MRNPTSDMGTYLTLTRSRAIDHPRVACDQDPRELDRVCSARAAAMFGRYSRDDHSCKLLPCYQVYCHPRSIFRDVLDPY